ncbi:MULTISPECIES: hypothetical protein [Paenibacillus]|uniref:hypothetical protein n=1 Tax=Paenibacillus TaxID=44249 RepID=UPI0022B9383C|nr:hypothetical protein [Paenibacillus caseinilyticus]MCZ8521915.1 hypothetical protein [Paenibacillus caseinilyticus]
MWSAFCILLIAGLIWMYEAPGLWRKGSYRDLAAFSLLLVYGTGVAMAQAAHLPIPNPSRGLEMVFRPAGEALERWLK